MKLSKNFIIGLGIFSIFVFVSSVQATLIDRGGGLIYDDDLNITWIQDVGLANTSGTPTGGRMSWADAVSWAENLLYFDSVRNVTWTNWRLPKTLVPDPSCSSFSNGFSGGKNCIGSEMGHLYYQELGNPLFQAPIQALNTGPFDINPINEMTTYWSGTSDPTNSTIAFTFDWFQFGGGGQSQSFKNTSVPHGAWAVRDGDVLQAPIPEPSTMLLFGSGLAGLLMWKQKGASLTSCLRN